MRLSTKLSMLEGLALKLRIIAHKQTTSDDAKALCDAADVLEYLQKMARDDKAVSS